MDGRGRPLAIVVTGGQRNDGAMLGEVLGEIRVPRRGRARTRPDVVIADRAYSTGVIRAELRRRRITAVIPAKTDAVAARKRRGSAGGRPTGFDAEVYKDRNVVERSFNQGQAVAGSGHPLRQTRDHLPSRCHSLRDHHLATHIKETRSRQADLLAKPRVGPRHDVGRPESEHRWTQ